MVDELMSSALHELVCPACRACSWESEQNTDQQPIRIRCSYCQHQYPVSNGVPDFVADSQYASSFGFEWSVFTRTQLDSANGTSISLNRFKQLSPFAPQSFRGMRVLEAGCGMGRFLEVLADNGALVDGIDLTEAVFAAGENLAGRSNVKLARGDLFSPPLPERHYDYAYSFGVLHHTPDPAGGLAALVRYVKPGGYVTTWVYGYRGWRWVPRPQEAYRLVFARLSQRNQLRFAKWYATCALKLGRIPAVGSLLALLFPVQDLRTKTEGQDGYMGEAERQLTEDLVFEWAWLNTFDMLSPQITNQYDFEEVEAWFRAAGLVDIKRGKVRVSVTGRVPETSTQSG